MVNRITTKPVVAPVVPVKVEEKKGYVANVTAAIKRCLGIKTPAPIAPKTVAPAPKKAQTKSTLKTALIGATVLAAVAGGSFAAYTNIPAVKNAADSAFATVSALFSKAQPQCSPNDKFHVPSGLESDSKRAAFETCPPNKG